MEKVEPQTDTERFQEEIEKVISDCRLLIDRSEERLSKSKVSEILPDRMPMAIEEDARRRIEELKAEMGEGFCRNRRKAFLKGREKTISDQLAAFRGAALPSGRRQLIYGLRGIASLERELKMIMLEFSALEGIGGDSIIPDIKRITDAEIALAKKYPFEALIEIGRGGMVRCVFHEDKSPSMLIKNGFAFCFSCNKSWDTIAFVQERYGLSFVEAVEDLLNGRAYR